MLKLGTNAETSGSPGCESSRIASSSCRGISQSFQARSPLRGNVDERHGPEVAGDLHDGVIPDRVAPQDPGWVVRIHAVSPQVWRRAAPGVLREARREEDRLAVAGELEDRVGELRIQPPDLHLGEEARSRHRRWRSGLRGRACHRRPHGHRRGRRGGGRACRHPYDAERDDRRRPAPPANHQTNRWVWSRIMPPTCLIGSQKRPVEPPSSSDESV